MLEKQCVVIKLSYTKKKIEEITRDNLMDAGMTMDDDKIDLLIKTSNKNLTTIFEQIKYLQNEVSKVDEAIDYTNVSFNYIGAFNNSIENEMIEYIKKLFKIDFNNQTINDIYTDVNYDINSLILLILENALKYVHNCSNKHYNKSINTICQLYDNISLSDNYEYLKIINHGSNSEFNNYIILHGIIIPIYTIYINNNNKKQFNYKDTSIYSKAIIEIYNNKKKIYIESISPRLKNINNFIKIYHYAKISENSELLEWCEQQINNDIVINKDIIKYIKYSISKIYGYKIKSIN
jgi:hypothetical protein